MKKIVFSLGSVLAIVLAVTSAFTTKKVTKPFASDYEVWSISNTVAIGTTDYSTIDNAKRTKLFDGGTSLPSGSTNDQRLQNAISDYNAANFPQFSCATNVSKMCVALLDRGTSPSVLAVDDGDSNF
jgi:hypothetical protein